MLKTGASRKGQVWRDIAMALQLVSPPFLKKFILRCFCKATVKRSAQIGWFSAVTGRSVELGRHCKIRPFTVIRCAGNVKIGDYAELSSLTFIYGASGLELGSHSYIGPQCLVDTTESVRIGCSSALGPRCMVFTHGSFLPYTEGYPVKFADVAVGDRTWVAAGVFIHPGVSIGSDVFINSRAVVTRDIPSGAVAEGNPATRLWGLDRFRRRMTARKFDRSTQQVIDRFAEVILGGEMGIEPKKTGAGALSFRYRGRRYLIAHVTSTSNGADPCAAGCDIRARYIFVANKPKWSPPPSVRDFVIFDLSTMRTAAFHDPVHARLFHFMRRYYGLQFEYEEKP